MKVGRVSDCNVPLQVVLPDAGHACYQDQPEAFHRVLINFLNKCHRTIQGEPVVKPDNEVRIEM